MSVVMERPRAVTGRAPLSPRPDEGARTATDGLHRFELDRLRALDSYRILDTDPEPGFDALAASAAILLNAPRAAITFVDAHRQWSKAAFGPGLSQLPREWSICADVVAAERTIIVVDLAAHPRYATNPATFGANPVRSYAGVPLIGRDGLPLGAFSVSDRRPRSFTEREIGMLAGLAQAAVALLEQRRTDIETGRTGAPLSLKEIDPATFTAAGVRHALRRGEFEVHFQPVVWTPDFQPVVSTPAGRIAGVHAVPCWNLPSSGLVADEYVQPHLQASSLLSQLFTEFVLNTSCLRLASWREMGGRDIGLSVEVSGHDLAGGWLPAMVAAAVNRAKIPYEALTLVVTEMGTVRDRAVARQHLDRLRELGVHVEDAAVLPISGPTRAPGYAGSRPVTAAHITELLRLRISASRPELPGATSPRGKRADSI